MQPWNEKVHYGMFNNKGMIQKEVSTFCFAYQYLSRKILERSFDIYIDTYIVSIFSYNTV